jgi:hypothetical protein
MILMLALLQASPLQEAERDMRAARGLAHEDFLGTAVELQRRALAALERYLDRFDPPPRFTSPFDALLPTLDRTPAGTPDPEMVELLRQLRILRDRG